MKKKFLFLVLGLACGSLMGCGKDQIKTKEVIDETILKYNIDELSTTNEPNRVVSGKLEEHTLKLPKGYKVLKETYDGYFDDYGIFVLINDAGYVGIYNAMYEAWLVKPSYEYYELTSEAYGRLFLKKTGDDCIIGITYKGQTLVIDRYGNTLYEGLGIGPSEIDVSFNTGYKGYDGFYVDVNVKGESQTYAYAEKHHIIPANEYIDRLMDNIDKLPSVGESINALEKLDLGLFGYPGYELIGLPNMDIIINKDGEYLRTNHLPFNFYNLESLTLIGCYGLGQEIYPLGETSEDYSIVVDGDKVLVKNILFNFITGEYKEVKFDYLIDGSAPLKNKDGIYELAAIQAVKVQNRTIIDKDLVLILDEDLEIRFDATTYLSGSLKKVGEHYYDSTSDLVFDKDFHPVFSLKEYRNVRYSTENGYFILSNYDNDFGIIDEYGKIIQPFVADEILTATNAPYYFSYNNDHTVTVGALDGSETTTYECIDATLKDNDKGAVLILEQETRTLALDFFGNVSKISDSGVYNTIGNGLTDLAFLKKTDYYDVTEGATIFTYRDFDVSIITHGEEITSGAGNGLSIYSPVTFSLGENKFESPYDMASTYFNFTPDKTGLYKFDSTEGVRPVKLDGVDTKTYLLYQEDGQLFLEKDKTYTMIVSTNKFTMDIAFVSEIPALEAEGFKIEVAIPDAGIPEAVTETRLLTVPATGVYSLDTTFSDVKIYDAYGNLLNEIEVSGKKGYGLGANEYYILKVTTNTSGEFKGLVSLELPEAGFEFINDEFNPWENNVTSNSYTSPAIGNHQTTTIKFMLYKAGTFSFNVDVSSEDRFDIAVVKVDNVEQLRISGFRQEKVTIEITKPTVVEIYYTKDSSNQQGRDNVIISNINYTFK